MSDNALQERNPKAASGKAGKEARTRSSLGIRPLFFAFGLIAAFLIATHATLLRLPYFWDEAGYYIPAARDLMAGSLIPHSTPSNAHPPLVMAWLALSWKIFGQNPLITRLAMLLLAAFSLTGFYRLARTVSNSSVAAASTFLTAIYPVFFAQSSLAQIDLPAAGLTFWAMDAHFRRRRMSAAIWFSLAALAKETAILVPIALAAWAGISGLLERRSKNSSLAPNPAQKDTTTPSIVWLLVPAIPLALWYAYHYSHTGFVFGNPEFLRYNLQGNFHPLRIVLALLLRIWQTFGYLHLWLLTLAGLLAMKYPALAMSDKTDKSEEITVRGSETKLEPENLRSRIAIPVQFAFLAITIVYLLALSVLGGAELARYMLPIVPLFILIAVSTIWRRLRAWKAVLAVVALGFGLGLFFNPPYGFSPEDNLAYADYVRLHQNAENFIEARYPQARVLTAWPASDELSRPGIGYVARPSQVVRIEDFTAEELMAAADERSRFDIALVFSTKVQPNHSFVDRWRFWQEWKARYFGYHVDLGPEAAASVLGGNLVYVERSVRRPGQWVAVIESKKIEEAGVLASVPCAAWVAQQGILEIKSIGES